MDPGARALAPSVRRQELGFWHQPEQASFRYSIPAYRSRARPRSILLLERDPDANEYFPTGFGLIYEVGDFPKKIKVALYGWR